MGLGVVHPHVEAFRCRIDFVAEFVRPGADDLLQVVVTELAVVKGVVTRIDGVLWFSAVHWIMTVPVG